MTVNIRSQIQGMSANYHGAIDFAELAEFGIRPDDVIDFSVNSNPFGPAPSVLEAIRDAKVERYPDKECLALRSALSDQIGVGMDQILVGNGSAELMWLVAFGFLNPGDDVLVIGPTFGEYGRNARLMGATVTEWQASADNDFRLDKKSIKQIEAEITRLRPKLVHICNPNNPTGQTVSRSVLEAWSAEHPDTLFVVDEAYAQFLVEVDGSEFNPFPKSKAGSAPIDPYGMPNVLTLRSMTKDYSLAGIRLGYLIASPHLVDGLRQCRIPWSVSEVAQAAGLAALAAQSDYDVMLEKLRAEARRFKKELAKLGYRIAPSPMHYFLMAVDDGEAFRDQLLRNGMLVRKCESFGLSEFVRISTQRTEENRRLLAFLKDT